MRRSEFPYKMGDKVEYKGFTGIIVRLKNTRVHHGPAVVATIYNEKGKTSLDTLTLHPNQLMKYWKLL